MSTTPSPETVTNERPGSAKWLMQASTSAVDAPATAAISASGVGRRTSRLSSPSSVMRLNISSATARGRPSPNSK